MIEYREGSDRGGVRKLPGLTKFSNVVLKRGITASRDLWNWRKIVINGEVDRRFGNIVVLGEDRNPLATFRFREGWPSKWEGPKLNAKANEVAIETLEITHEGFDVE